MCEVMSKRKTVTLAAFFTFLLIVISAIVVVNIVIPLLEQQALENRLKEICLRDPRMIDYLHNFPDSYFAGATRYSENPEQWHVKWDAGIIGLWDGVNIIVDIQTETVISFQPYSG